MGTGLREEKNTGKKFLMSGHRATGRNVPLRKSGSGIKGGHHDDELDNRPSFR